MLHRVSFPTGKTDSRGLCPAAKSDSNSFAPKASQELSEKSWQTEKRGLQTFRSKPTPKESAGVVASQLGARIDLRHWSTIEGVRKV